MPNVTQVYPIINSMAKQMWGENALSVIDTRGVIAMGDEVFSSNENKELFYGVLADRIAKTNLRTLDLELDFPRILRNSYEWGMIISKINIQPMDAQSQEAWKVGDDNFTPTNFKIDKSNVSCTFFKGPISTWEFDLTIPDTMLKTAFINATEFGAFLDGIMQAMSDSMTMALNNMSYLAIKSFVAEKVKNSNGVINVLTNYNTQAGTDYKSLTEALDDKEFYRYVGMVMRNVIKYMSKPSKLYNIGGKVRATARDNMHVLVSSDFWSGYTTYLSSDTFHDEMVALDGFAEFVTLQGTGNTGIPTIENNTKMSIIPPSNADDDTTAVEVDGVIGIITDREAIFTGYEDMFTATDRNNRNRYTNYTSGASIMYGIDTSENGVVIVAN